MRIILLVVLYLWWQCVVHALEPSCCSKDFALTENCCIASDWVIVLGAGADLDKVFTLFFLPYLSGVLEIQLIKQK